MQGKYDASVALYDSLINKKHVIAQLKAVHDNAKAAEDAAMQELRTTIGADDLEAVDESSSWKYGVNTRSRQTRIW